MLLSKRWMNILISNKKSKNEPWFNNNIRKFSVLLLEYFESLSEEEKKSYIEFIKNNISGDEDE